MTQHSRSWIRRSSDAEAEDKGRWQTKQESRICVPENQNSRKLVWRAEVEKKQKLLLTFKRALFNLTAMRPLPTYLGRTCSNLRKSVAHPFSRTPQTVHKQRKHLNGASKSGNNYKRHTERTDRQDEIDRDGIDRQTGAQQRTWQRRRAGRAGN